MAVIYGSADKTCSTNRATRMFRQLPSPQMRFNESHTFTVLHSFSSAGTATQVGVYATPDVLAAKFERGRAKKVL